MHIYPTGAKEDINKIMAVKIISLSTLPALLAGAVVIAGAGAPIAMASAMGPEDLKPAGTAIVIEIIDGDTVALDDGREIRLVGIQAPKLPLGQNNFTPWPLADIAKAEIKKLCMGKKVNIFTPNTSSDRHGRTLAHLVVDDGQSKFWLQGEMLARGMARVYTFSDNRVLAAEMLKLERGARKNSIGIWENPFYKIVHQNKTEGLIGTFQLVEGVVLNAEVVGKRAYLNFGKKWRTDFTITIEKPGLKIFSSANVDINSYKGKLVRVRGWIRSKNGPMIEVTHPEQIEILKH